MKGIVVAQSGRQTVRVRVTRRFRHPIYHKVIARHKEYLVHAPEAVSNGSEVGIVPHRPISRRKRHIIQRPATGSLSVTAELSK